MISEIIFVLKNFLRDFKPPPPNFTPQDYPDLTGKTAFVTGASAGVGLQVAKLLASKNCHVILGVRNKVKTEGAIEAILEELGNNNGFPIGKLEIIIIDLADLTTIKKGFEQLKLKINKLNIIIHNAGVLFPPLNSKTVQGFDLQFGTNTIGPFLLQRFLDDFFLKNDDEFKRIIWVSSSMHLLSPSPGGINWQDINFEAKQSLSYHGYAQSKASNIILAALWARKKIQRRNIICVSVHPGYLESDLTSKLLNCNFLDKLGKLFCLYPSVFGAYTELYALLSPRLDATDNGSYIVPWGSKADIRLDVKESCHNENGERLWRYLEEQASKYYQSD